MWTHVYPYALAQVSIFIRARSHVHMGVRTRHCMCVTASVPGYMLTSRVRVRVPCRCSCVPCTPGMVTHLRSDVFSATVSGRISDTLKEVYFHYFLPGVPRDLTGSLLCHFYTFVTFATHPKARKRVPTCTRSCSTTRLARHRRTTSLCGTAQTSKSIAQCLTLIVRPMVCMRSSIPT